VIADYTPQVISPSGPAPGPFYVATSAQTLGIPENRIRVTATEVGGGFGGKICLTELMVAALAMVVHRPVKRIMSRREDMLAATQRHSRGWS
jgi:CO/xanthine dehydrogenase Mo-binding subunit